MNNQSKAEVLLYIIAGDDVPSDVESRALPFVAELAESVSKSDGRYQIALWDDGAVYATGDTPWSAIQDAIVMIANGAHFDA